MMSARLQTGQASALVKEYPELRDQRIGDCKLGQGESGDSELADTEHPHPKLRVSPPQANCPMAIIPFAGTGTRLGRNLKHTCRMGNPKSVAWDLYSNPHPSQRSLAGYSTPQLGQTGACSETAWPHSLQGFIQSSVL
jgi:hypothetical protein